jgi:hypothetical protein
MEAVTTDIAIVINEAIYGIHTGISGFLGSSYFKEMLISCKILFNCAFELVLYHDVNE